MARKKLLRLAIAILLAASPVAASGTPLTDSLKDWFGKHVYCMNADDHKSTRRCSGDEMVSFVRIKNGYAEIELRGALANPTSGYWQSMRNGLFGIATKFRGIKGVRITENGGKAPHLDMACNGRGPCVVFGAKTDPGDYFDITIDALISED